MERIHNFEEENIISFSNRTELIQFVSNYLSRKYKDHLEFWRATAADDRGEIIYWEKRIEIEVPKFEKAIKKLLRRRLISNITHKSLILKKAFKKAKIKVSPENCFAINVEYKIDNLMFYRNVKPVR